MRRYSNEKGQDPEDLETRLNEVRSPGSRRSRKRRKSRVAPAVIGLLLIALSLGAVLFLYNTASGGGEQAANGPVEITVSEGDSLSSVADKLNEARVVDSTLFFEIEARLSGQSTQIKPGEYTIQPDEGGGEVLAKLTAVQPPEVSEVTLPEGLTLEQTARQVAEQSEVSVEEFAEAARSTDYDYAFLDDPAIETTEGFLFPKTYEFEKGTGARQMVDRMLEQYRVETEGLDIQSASDELNLSEYELLTTASLIESEAANASEKPIIASVIYNRIRQGIPLQIDATVRYALDKPEGKLSLQNLEVESPYNTYENPALPPGPISNPSLESIKAALNPAETDHLYYVLKPGGEEHFFTDNYDEFLRVKEESSG